MGNCHCGLSEAPYNPPTNAPSRFVKTKAYLPAAFNDPRLQATNAFEAKKEEPSMNSFSKDAEESSELFLKDEESSVSTTEEELL